jgi:RNA polymerase sigma factor (sigma-70 family)
MTETAWAGARGKDNFAFINHLLMLTTSVYDHPNNELATLASAGDWRSFERIYELISGRMYSLCLRYAGNREDANDWFQDGFLKLYRNLPSYRAAGSFEGWARRIFVTRCIDGLKKRKMLFPIQHEDFDGAAVEPGIFDQLNVEDIFYAIRQLPDCYRVVVNLYLVEGYGHKEIKELLQISEESSRSQLFRGRVALKKILSL